MTHEFEADNVKVLYFVTELEPKKSAVIVVLLVKSADKYTAFNTVINKSEEELLSTWKEKNDSKYVKSYN